MQTMSDIHDDHPSSPMLYDDDDAGASARRQRTVVKWLGRLAVPLVVIGLWELSAARGWINPFFTSRPTDVGEFLREAVTDLSTWQDLWVTLKEALMGFVIGSVLGVLIGLVFIRMPLLHEIMAPYVTALNSLPRIALAPLFVLWFGLGPQSKVVLVVSLVFFIVLGATMGAVGNVDPDLTRLGRVLGLRPRYVFFRVMLPWAVPGIFAGLQLALVYAFLGAVAGEMLAAKEGIGQELQYKAGVLDTAGVLGLLVLLALVSTTLSMGMEWIRKRLMRYRA